MTVVQSLSIIHILIDRSLLLLEKKKTGATHYVLDKKKFNGTITGGDDDVR